MAKADRAELLDDGRALDLGRERKDERDKLVVFAFFKRLPVDVLGRQFERQEGSDELADEEKHG